MLNLLKFEFRRLFKSLFFKIIGIFCIAWPFLVTVFFRIILSLTLDGSGMSFEEFDMSGDELKLFTWIISVSYIGELPKFLALFACLHIGRDFTDGIVRNKITAGHSRPAIFFSYMITQLTATVMFCVVYIASALIGMLICGVGADINGGEMLIRHAVGICTLLVMTVLFVSLSLIFRKRAIPIVLSIVVVMMLSTATSIVGTYNLPSKAVDDYIELRHERYEDLVDEGVLTDDQMEMIEEEFDRDSYLGIPWKICHPAYLFTTTGFNGDYSTDPLQLIVGELEYKDELDFSTTFVSDYYDLDMSGITTKDLKRFDSMHISFSTLNLIYFIKSMLWILAIGSCGFIIFRKKNLF